MPARARAVLLALLLIATPGRAQLPGIGPADGRVRVDAGAMPWAAVARLQIAGVSRCTAVLVAPSTALTAAHCLWDRRLGRFAGAGRIHVLSRYAGGQFAAHTVATAYRVAPGFDPRRPGSDRGADVAVVTLARPLGNDVLALVAAPPPGTAAMLGGYNQDRAEVIAADAACHIVASGRLLVVHDCDATRGTSGAPLLVRGADGAWRLAGLQVGAFSAHAGGVAVAGDVLMGLLDHPGPAP